MNYRSHLFQEVSFETIQTIFQKTLGTKVLWRAELLDGGLFNTTYFVEYGPEHKQAVLRLGPVNRHLTMGFEENLMEAEAWVYDRCREIGIPCSRVLACDTSKEILDRDFMIVEYIPSIVMAKAELTDEQRRSLYIKMGAYLRKLHQVTGDSFGFVSRLRAGQTFDRWSDALIFEVRDIAERYVQSGGIGEETAQKVLTIFEQNRDLLDQVRTPHLLHTDLWEGNVLLDRETLDIAAIIDCDRAVFGDVDFEFAASWMENPALKEGYGQTEQPPGREQRRQLYRLFSSLLEGYVWYAEYDNMEIYESCKEKLLDLCKKENV